MSFKESGIISTTEESDQIYTRVIVGALLSISIIVPIFGYVSDKADPRLIISFTFIMRCFIAASFRFIEDPRNLVSYLLCVLLITISVVQFISVEVLFMRNMKSHIRGILSGLAYFFGSFGVTAFAMLGGILFDKVAPWALFILVSIADGTVFVICLIFIFFGLIKASD